MRTLTLKPNSLWLRWGFILMPFEKVPHDQVSICVLFWQCLLGAPLRLALAAGIIGSMLFGLGYVAFWLVVGALHYPVLMYVELLAVLAIAGTVVYQRRGGRFSETLVAEFVRAKKQRWCLMIQIRQEDEDDAAQRIPKV